MIETIGLSHKSYVVDIGAHRGIVSKRLCEYIQGSPQRFFLLEPHPDSFLHLRRTMPKFNTYQLAIGSRNGKVALYYDEHYLNASSLYQEMAAGKGGNVKAHVVPCMTLDTFLADKNVPEISLLKINCEGSEFDIFEAPTLDFLKRTRYIKISFHGKRQVFIDRLDDKLKIVRILKENGFRWADGVRPSDLGKNVRASHEVQVWINDNFHGS